MLTFLSFLVVALLIKTRFAFSQPEETQPKKIQKANLVLALKTGRKKAQTSKQKHFTYLSYKLDVDFPEETTS